MSINKFNSEGCGSPVETSRPKAEKHRPNRQVRHYDHTTYALTNIEKVWAFGSRIFSGMETEIKRARWKNYRLRFFKENCEGVIDHA